jgi:hypothetical protein
MAISLASVRRRLQKVIATLIAGRLEQREQAQEGFSAQICLRCNLGATGNRRKHPDWNFESLTRGIENGDRAIALFWSPENPQSIAVKRMKRIKNLDVCDVRTQGIVRDDGFIRMSTAWSRRVVSPPTSRIGFIPSTPSSCPWRCSASSTAASSCAPYESSTGKENFVLPGRRPSSSNEGASPASLIHCSRRSGSSMPNRPSADPLKHFAISALYPSCRHQQSSAVGLRWRTGHVPLARLRPRQPAAHHDSFGLRVSAPLYTTHPAARLYPHPALRFSHQQPSGDDADPRPSADRRRIELRCGRPERALYSLHVALSSLSGRDADRTESLGSSVERAMQVSRQLVDRHPPSGASTCPPGVRAHLCPEPRQLPIEPLFYPSKTAFRTARHPFNPLPESLQTIVSEDFEPKMWFRKALRILTEIAPLPPFKV